MTLKGLLLTLAAALTLTVPVTAARDFSGLGQIRTLYITDDHEDLGCLTSQGRWTADESQCGTFVAVRDAHDFKLAAVDGGKCGVDVATFKCGQGAKWDVFGVRNFILFLFSPLIFFFHNRNSRTLQVCIVADGPVSTDVWHWRADPWEGGAEVQPIWRHSYERNEPPWLQGTGT